MVKFCSASEKKLASAKKDALTQTASIEKVFTTIDEISASLRTTRLSLNKLVKEKKEEVKNKMATKAFDHIESVTRVSNIKLEPFCLDTQIGFPYFTNAMKGKRTLVSMQQSVDECTAKLTAEIGNRTSEILRNIEEFNAAAEGYGHLFLADSQQLVWLSTGEMTGVVSQRIATEEARLAKIEEDKKAKGKAQTKAVEKREEAAKEFTEEKVSAVKEPDIHEELAEWGVKHNIPTVAMNDLYNIVFKGEYQ